MDEQTPPATPKKRRRPPKPFEIALEAAKDNREGLTLMRPESEVTLTPATRFVLVPGDKGRGWMLRVYPDPE